MEKLDYKKVQAEVNKTKTWVGWPPPTYNPNWIQKAIIEAKKRRK